MSGRDAGVRQWKDVVKVRQRYQRSVHLERDASDRRALDGYVLTPLVRTLASRIVDGLGTSGRTRAWSVTGPYGTGKSAFALLLANLLSRPSPGASQAARRLVLDADPALAAALRGPGGAFPPNGGLLPVLATGERRRLDQILLRSLLNAAQQFWAGRGAKPSIVGRVAKLAQRAEAGKQVSSRDVVSAFLDTAAKISESNLRGDGLLVILDEAGKVLEHAALHPEDGDVQLMQELAEAANRCDSASVVFVVMLHQAFEQYAGRLSLTERNEWAKVQGRFEDLAFQEGSHELLRLVGEALDTKPLSGQLHSSCRNLVSSAAKLAMLGSDRSAGRIDELLSRALPLHPFTALLLGPVFRSRIAQNERSLFAFMASSEPHGLQEFFASSTLVGRAPRVLLPDQLYDYVTGSLGARFHGHLGKQWAQIETALRRLPDCAGDIDARVIKTVGLLGLFGDAAGIRASEDVVRLTYGGIASGGEGEVVACIDRLKKASLVIFRKFRNAYQLWEGSDIDVDALTRDALVQADVNAHFVARLARVAPPRPIVARKHLFQTGTLRYFELRYVETADFDEGIPEGDPGADGVLLLVIEPNANSRQRLVQRLLQPTTWATLAPQARPVLVAVPRQVGRIVEFGSELAAIEWVQTHTPELQEDLVARREVAARLIDSERQLRNEMARLLGGGIPCDWILRGRSLAMAAPRDLARTISDICDDAYARAPVILNELLNRRQLSSAAAAARRSLMEAMVERSSEERLGFQGNPPEISMYRSLLEHHELHRRRDGVWLFGMPKERIGGSLRPAWEAIERALDEAHEGRLCVPAIYDRLRRPPLGLKDGVIPVVLLAAMLSWRDEVALYEDGAFVPAMSGAVIERLLRGADRFEVQRLSIVGPRAALFRRLAQMLLSGRATSSPGILPIVRQLVRIAKDLPDFSRNTNVISARAQAVRETLLRAREPAPLLFQHLPVACGMLPFKATGTMSGKAVDRFVEELRAAIRELQLAYPRLLELIEDALRTGIALPADAGKLRSELGIRAQRLLPVVVDSQLKAFLLRAAERDLGRDEWLVSMGTFLGNKPPDSWHDRDIDQMRLSLGLVSRRFLSLESMMAAAESDPLPAGTSMLRVAISEPGAVERERAVVLREEDAALVSSVCAQLQSISRSVAASLSRESMLAALALVARELIAELDDRRPGRELTQ